MSHQSPSELRIESGVLGNGSVLPLLRAVLLNRGNRSANADRRVQPTVGRRVSVLTAPDPPCYVEGLRANRTTRLLIALASVWCLGCDSFEATLDAVLRASDDAGAAMTLANAAGVVSSVGTDQHPDDCHCVQGHAAQVAALDAVSSLTAVSVEHPARFTSGPALSLSPPVPPPIG